MSFSNQYFYNNLRIAILEPRNTVPYYNDDINEQVVPSLLCEELELEPNTVVEDDDMILSPPIASCKLSPPIASFKVRLLFHENLIVFYSI